MNHGDDDYLRIDIRLIIETKKGDLRKELHYAYYS